MIRDNITDAMRRAGLVYDGEIAADGKRRRFKAGDDKNRNSWFILFPGSPAVGVFGCWKRGFKETWCERNGAQLSKSETEAMRRRIEQAEREQQKTEAELRERARKTADWILSRAKPADAAHSYLTSKGVQPHGDVREYRGSLVVPLRDADLVLHSLQFIGADGSKKFLRGGRVQGCFFTLAEKSISPLVLCEGYATGASINEASGYSVICAMNAGNLLVVAKALRAKFPDRDMIIAADSDAFTVDKDGRPFNPGMTKATEAAKTIRARLAVPQFADLSTKPTDFNDLVKLEGFQTVKEKIEHATTPTETDEETFNRLAKLSRVDYDRQAKTEAKRLGISKSTLDGEVEARRPAKTLQGPGVADIEVKPWDAPVNGSELLDAIRATYLRFIVLPPHADILLPVWTLHTYIFDRFSFTPYLHISSPERECGKSTLAELMQHVCSNATTPGGMSAAAMYRRIESRRPVLLLDEWDTLQDETRLAALNVLNTGFKWNGVYTICVGDDHEDRDFHTFCPKAIFGLAATKLPDTTRSRCFALALQKKLRTERIDKLTRKFSGLELRRKCLRWAHDNIATLANREPDMPPGLSARQEDISEPLLVVADACGGSWPAIVRQCILSFFGEVDPDEGDIKREMLADIRRGFAEQDPPDRFDGKTMTKYLNALEHRPWHSWNDGNGITQRQIADRLRDYRIKSRNMKVAPEVAKSGVAKGYLLTDFEDAFTRYLSPVTDSIRYPATDLATIDRNAVLASATVSAGSVSENATSANTDGAGSAVADCNPQNGPTAPITRPKGRARGGLQLLEERL